MFGPINANAKASGGPIETTTVSGCSVTPSGGSFFATFGGINFALNIGLLNFRELPVDVGGGNKKDRTNDAPTEFTEAEREAIDPTINAAIDLAGKKKNFAMVGGLVGSSATAAFEMAARLAWQQWILSIARSDADIRQNTNLRGTLTDNLGCMAMRQGSRGGRIQCY